ncbi:hypothetical protein [Serratia proteamaculans]|uniref:hypothetical protein n=1 Tax=Serratia proteamaculans TaxID=28151 RepID=UPI00197DAFD5|nr:hypothetical protein [Serratia proteamaculans]
MTRHEGDELSRGYMFMGKAIRQISNADPCECRFHQGYPVIRLVTVVTDASGGVSVEAHEVAIQRMIAAGANIMTWLAVASEWQRDWARTEHAAALADILKYHVGGSGIALMWEQQLLNTPIPGVAGDVGRQV